MGKLDQETGALAWRPNCSTSRTSRVPAKLNAQQKIHQSVMPIWESPAPCTATLKATQANTRAARRTHSSWEVGTTNNGMMGSQSLRSYKWQDEMNGWLEKITVKSGQTESQNNVF